MGLMGENKGIILDRNEAMIESGEITCDVEPSNDKWFGVPNAQDTPIVNARFKEVTDEGVYPVKLWG